MTAKKILVSLAGAITVATLLACGVGSNNGNRATVGEGTPPAEGSDKPSGPVTAKMGQTITVDASLFGRGEQVAAYTVADGKKLKPTSSYDTPDHGQYYGVTLTVVVQAGSTFACGMDISFVAKDGTVYEPTISMHKGAFQCADLGKGQRKSGLVVFDVPPAALTGGRIQVKNFWDEEPYGFWTV